MADEIKRMHYFNGLFLKEDDFTLDQDYHTRMRRIHNRHLHTWGIAWGMEVVNGPGSTQITVSEGMAINKVLKDGEEIGQEIILPLDQEVDLSEYSHGDGVYIYISYSEEEADIVPEKGGDTKNIHWLEKAVISHSTTKPVNENEDIIMAKVVIKGDGTIDAASIEYYDEEGNSLRTYSGFAGKSLQAERLTLSIEGVTSNLASMEGKKFGSDNGIQITSPRTDFSGSLTIDGNLGIGTSPSERLHINGSVRGDQSGALRINTGNGYTDIGAKDANWSHFNTDRPKYYFDKEIRVKSGLIGSYNENLQLRTSGETRLTIRNDNGNVGIGTTSPESILHIASSSDAEVRLDPGKNSGWRVVGQWGLTRFDIMEVGQGSRLTITGGGNVGIGTTSPGASLEVAKDIALGGTAIRVTNTNPANNNGHAFETIQDGRSRIRIAPDNISMLDSNGAETISMHSMTGNIYASGTITQGSSRELKQDITDLSTHEAMETFRGLKPVKFVYKADKEKDLHIGFIAEDVPETVATPDRKGISPMDIVGLLTKVVQEQQREIKELKAIIYSPRSQAPAWERNCK